MLKAKRFLSVFLAVIMAFGTCSCLTSVLEPIANAKDCAFWANTTPGGITTAKTVQELNAEYETNGNIRPYTYIATEFYEQDGDNWVPTDHKVTHGQQLKMKIYLKTDYATNTFLIQDYFDRSFFDITNGEREGDHTYVADNKIIPVDNYPTGRYPLRAQNVIVDGINNLDGVIQTLTVSTFPALAVKSMVKDDKAAVTYFGADATSPWALSLDKLRFQTGMATGALGSTEIGPYNQDFPLYEVMVTVLNDGANVGHTGMESCYFFRDTNSNYVKGDGTTAARIKQGADKIVTSDTALYPNLVLDVTDTQHTFVIDNGETPPTPTAYKATFNANGGVCETKELTGDENNKVTMPEATKSGFSLKWSDGTKTYSVGEVVTLTKDTEFTAQWTPVQAEQVTITFAVKGEYTSSGQDDIIDTVTVDKGSVVTPPAESKYSSKIPAGYQVLGQAFIGVQAATENKTYYLNLTPKSVKITFKIGDKTVADQSTGTQVYKQTLKTPAQTAINNALGNGKSFDGKWYKDPDCGTQISANETVPATDTTYYGKAEDILYTVKFMLDNGTEYTQGRLTNLKWGDKIDVPTYDTDEYSYRWKNVPETVNFTETEKSFTAEKTARVYTVTYIIVNPLTGTEVERLVKDGIAKGAAVPAYDGNYISNGTCTIPGVTFNGWSAAIPAAMPAENLTFTAKLSKTSYSVKFIGFNGTVDTAELKSMTKYYGDTIAATDIPAAEKDGNSLSWQINGVNTDPVGYKVTGNVEFKAKYTAGEFTITYKLSTDGGQTYEVYGTPQKLKTGDAVTPVPFPVAPGYAETDWTNAADIPTTMPGHDVVILGTKTAKQHIVKFEYEDGQQVTAPVTLKYGDKITKPVEGTDFTVPQGYSGYVWKYNGQAFTDDYLNIDDDITLVLTFNQGSSNYTVITKTMKTDGKTYEEKSEVRQYTTGEKLEMQAPTAPKGFSLNANASSLVIDAVKGDGSSQIVIVFDRNKYKITWNDAEGSYDKEYYYDAAVTCEKPRAKAGATVRTQNGGWDSAVPSKMPANNLTFTAQYNDGTFNIVFKYTFKNANGEEVTRTYTTLNGKYGEPVDASSVGTPSPAGYVFKNWKTVIPTSYPQQDIEIYANLEICKYKLTVRYFDSTKQKDIMNPVETEYEYCAAIQQIEQKTFDGFTYDSIDQVPSIMPSANKEIKVYYTRNKVDVKFDIDGTVKTPVGGTYYDYVPEMQQPTKLGYDFKGWSLTKNGDVLTELPKATAPATYYAVFLAKTLTATFDADGGEGGKFSNGNNIKTVENITFGNTFSAPQETPAVNEYFIFDGWALKGTNTPVTEFKMTGEGMEYVAIWKRDMTKCAVQDFARVTDEYFETGLAQYYVIVKGDYSRIKIEELDKDGNPIANLSKTFTKSKASESYGVAEPVSAGLVSVTETGTDTYKWTFNTYLNAANFRFTVKLNSYDWEENGLVKENTFDSKVDKGVANNEFFSAKLLKAAGSTEEVYEIVRGEKATWVIETATDVEWLKFNCGAEHVVNNETVKDVKSAWYLAKNSSVVDGDKRIWTIEMTFTYSGAYETEEQVWGIEYCLDGKSAFADSGKGTTVTVKRYENSQGSSQEDTYVVYSAETYSNGLKQMSFDYKEEGEFVIVTTDDVTKIQIEVNGKKTTYQSPEKSNNTLSMIKDGNGNCTWTIKYKFTEKGTNAYTIRARGTAWPQNGETVSVTVR